MKKTLYLAIVLAILVGGGVLISKVPMTQAAGPYPLTGWAWSSNVGWISFNSTNPGAGGGTYSVKADDAGNLTGYAWSSNIGWISFEPTSLSQAPACNGTTAAHVDFNTGEVVGWARATVAIGRSDGWDGCIELTGTNHPKNDPTGNGGVYYDKVGNKLKGFSWSDAVIGWLSFMPTLATYVVVPPTTTGISGTCSFTSTASPVTTATPVTFTANVSGGTGTYTNYQWFTGEGIDTTTIDTNIKTYNGPIAAPFSTKVKVTDSAGTTGEISCGNITVASVAGGSTGLRLIIAPTSVDDANLPTDYNDNDHSFESARIIKGNQFKLKWNVKQPDMQNAGYDTYEMIFSPGGPAASWGSLSTNGGVTINTSGISTGKYTYSLEISDAAGTLDVKTSSVELNIVSSTEEEI